MRSFWTAFRYLTIFPWPRNPPLAPQIGQSMPFFPVVGLCLGLLLVLLNRILEPYLASEILGVVLVAILVLATRAQQLDGLRGTFDAIGSGGGDGEGGSGSYVAIFGLLAVLVVIMLKFRAIEVMGEARNQGLILAPVLSRWSVVILAYSSRLPRREQKSAVMLESVSGWHLFWATTLTLPMVILFSGGLGLWISLWLSLLTLVAGFYLQRRQRGVSGNDFGAVGEVTEALAMVLFASLY